MDIIHSRGLILSSSNYGESDIQCVVLTKDSGKKRIVFKGLRKSSKRPRTAAEPGALIDFTYYFHPGKNSHVASDFSCIDTASTIRNNYLRICIMLFLLEITEKTTAFDDPSEQLFELLVSAKNILSSTDSPLHLAAVYCLHCLRIHGLQPDFTRCKACGAAGFSSFMLDPADLQPLCQSCNRRTGKELPLTFRDFLVQGLTRKFKSIDCEHYPEEIIRDFLYIVILYIEDHYSAEIHSGRFILEN